MHPSDQFRQPFTARITGVDPETGGHTWVETPYSPVEADYTAPDSPRQGEGNLYELNGAVAPVDAVVLARFRAIVDGEPTFEFVWPGHQWARVTVIGESLAEPVVAVLEFYDYEAEEWVEGEEVRLIAANAGESSALPDPTWILGRRYPCRLVGYGAATPVYVADQQYVDTNFIYIGQTGEGHWVAGPGGGTSGGYLLENSVTNIGGVPLLPGYTYAGTRRASPSDRYTVAPVPGCWVFTNSIDNREYGAGVGFKDYLDSITEGPSGLFVSGGATPFRLRWEHHSVQNYGVDQNYANVGYMVVARPYMAIEGPTGDPEDPIHSKDIAPVIKFVGDAVTVDFVEGTGADADWGAVVTINVTATITSIVNAAIAAAFAGSDILDGGGW